MIEFLIRLVLAHIIGDFVLQKSSWVKHKEEHLIRSKYLYYHVGIHLIVTFALLGFDLHYWLGLLIITASHWGIDLLKNKWHNKYSLQKLFIGDQIAHLLVLLGVSAIYFPDEWTDLFPLSDKALLLITCLVFLIWVSSIMMKVLISRWNIDDDRQNSSLQNAGKIIGILERLFIFIFIITDHWEGVGFLLAAKSIFRFGDLTKSNDRKLTEYILIGTLLSFAIGMALGLCYNYISMQL